MKIIVKVKGSMTSGNWGHKGRIGQRGGSAFMVNLGITKVILLHTLLEENENVWGLFLKNSHIPLAGYT